MLKSCLTCKIEFEAKTTAMWCSKECKKLHTKKCIEENKRLKAEEQKRSFVQTDDKVQCLICGGAWGSLSSHLSRTHNITADEYRARFNVGSEAIFSKKNLALMSERMAGSNNIAAGHGGRLSPFSKNNKKLDGKTELEKEAFVKESVDKWIKTVPKEDRPMNVEYWVKRGMTEEDARAEVSRRQATFSLEKCKERYGEEEGLKRWQERQDNWIGTINSKSFEEIQAINQSKIWKSGSMSKVSKELFEHLNIENARWGSKNGGEMMVQLSNKRTMIDFSVGKKIIEFYGDYWHAHPEKYPDDSAIFKRRKGYVTASYIRQQDNERITELTAMGYDVLIIWEDDYRKNKEGTIEKCSTFLKE
jgi:predicted transcriptional regulator/G:T-mismatch repair DNA endonuclease (very short patch repair protein)